MDEEIENNTKKSCIYLLTFPNKKHYVGQTKRSFERRMSEHYSNSEAKHRKKYKGVLYNAIRHYEWNNIKKEIICYCEESELNDLEVHYIKKYNSLHPNGYNLTTGGDSKKEFSTITIEKLRAVNKGRKQTAEHKVNLSIACKKKYALNPIAEEVKQKIKESNLKFYSRTDDEFKKHMQQRLDKRKQHYLKNGVSETTRKNRSEKLRKHKFDLPMYVFATIRSGKTSFRISARHPLMDGKSKTFHTKEECLKYYDNLYNVDENTSEYDSTSDNSDFDEYLYNSDEDN
jgi:hypothetical protein